jgi:hypothetical protein
MGLLARKLGFLARKWTAPTVRKALQAELDKWCESYEWDAKAALDAGDVVHLHSVMVRAEMASALLEPHGLRVAENVGLVHVGRIAVRIDLKVSSDLGFFSKPWLVTVEHVDVVLELVKHAVDPEKPSAATAAAAPPPPEDRSNLTADEAAVSTAARGHGFICRYILLQVAPGAALGMTLAAPTQGSASADDRPALPQGLASIFPNTPQLKSLAHGGVAEASGLLQVGDSLAR